MRKSTNYERLVVKGSTITRQQFCVGKWFDYGVWTKASPAAAAKFAERWT